VSVGSWYAAVKLHNELSFHRQVPQVTWYRNENKTNTVDRRSRDPSTELQGSTFQKTVTVVCNTFFTSPNIYYTFSSQDGDQTMGWMIWVLFPAETIEVFILKGVQTGSRFDPASHSMGTRTFYRGTAAGDHLQLVPSLRMSGAIPLLSLYAFMV
jgi:hypothetical protein